jgi:oligosaccharide amylase
VAKSYFNNIIIGNSRILGCLSDRGELIRFYWPNIGFGQHIDKFLTGFRGIDPEHTVWPAGEGWECAQQYIGDTNIAKTVMKHRKKMIETIQLDYAIPGMDALVRRLTVRGIPEGGSLSLVFYGMLTGSMNDPGNTMFDFDTDSMVFYKHGCYIAVSSDREIEGFQIGNGALQAASAGRLSGLDNIGMMNEGAFCTKAVNAGYKRAAPGEIDEIDEDGIYEDETDGDEVNDDEIDENKISENEIHGNRVDGDKIGGYKSYECEIAENEIYRIAKSGEVTVRLYVCASDKLKEARALMRKVKSMDENAAFRDTCRYWYDFLKTAVPVNTGDKKLDSLYRRSVLHFKLMSDERYGGILASPEVDEENTRCGRYAFCWGRDAAFIAGAMNRCGLHGLVENFYRWAVNTQEDDGSWQQRYFIDGNLAPSWGLQVDETGAIVWGMLQHYYAVKDLGFLTRTWECVKKAVDFLISFIDEETGLPKPGFDLWEERYGEHAYSAAAVYGGITAGAQIGRILGKSRDMTDNWDKVASGIREAIANRLWSGERGHFLRSIRVKLNPWGEEYSSNKILVQYNSKGYYKEVTAEDWTIDASVLGIAVPFDVFPVCDPRVVSSASRIEESLFCRGPGGLMRYEGDGYMGGNPWIITTLWMALFHIKRGEHGRALDYLRWASGTVTETGLLPEQADRNNGKPCWVFGLTWSHAMYVLVLLELIEAGALPGHGGKGCDGQG